VNRTKTPVLTSPWKIGFFVSLMLVVVSAAVAYFFSRKMGTSWAWPHGGDWAGLLEDTMRGQGFLFDMWPVLAVVGLTSLVSYVAITRAVRKYKRYLESGLDYRQLLASLRDIKDLEDKSQIDKLRNHPELRDCLLKVREALAKRSADLDEQRKTLEKTAREKTEGMEKDLGKRLDVECGQLVGAVESATRGGFPTNVNVSMPELKGVEEALRGAFSRQVSQTDHEAAVSALQTANDSARKQLARIGGKLEEGIETARDIEQRLAGMVSAGSSAGGPESATIQQDFEALRSSLAEVDQLSASLGVIGEEAKGVAINTALKAGSGKGTQADLIQLAEDVKEVAARFNKLSKSYLSATEGISKSVTSVEATLNRTVDSASSESSASSMAERMSRWVESILILSEKTKKGGESHSLSPVEQEITKPSSAADSLELTDYGFETMDRGASLFSDAGEAEDSPDIQRDGEILNEPSSEGAMFAELSETQATGHVHSSVDGDDEPLVVETPQSTSAEAQAESSPSHARKVPSTPVGVEEIFAEPDVPPVDVEIEKDVIDLYALGAVDFNPAVHS